MSIFSAAAGQQAGHGTNRKASWFDWKTDTGEMILAVRSMPLKSRRNGGAQLVPVEMSVVVHDPGSVDQQLVSNLDNYNPEAKDGKLVAAVKGGEERTFLLDFGKSGTVGAIKQQEFKALVTAAANVPLADELLREAIERLQELTGEEHNLKSLEGADDASLKGARDSLIDVLMQKWTEGEGVASKGFLLKCRIWPRFVGADPSRNRHENRVYTSTRYVPLNSDERALVAAIVEAGDDGIDLDGGSISIPANVRELINID